MEMYEKNGSSWKGINIAGLAKKHGVKYSTLYNRLDGKVEGYGHKSGGPRTPKILTKGEQY